jgi:energy-coupling factor transporter ATP-binding protein EcfA2
MAVQPTRRGRVDPPDATLQVLRWDDMETVFSKNHKQGEHVSIVGQTGSGKSVLGMSLCKVIAKRTADDGRPARVVVIATKPRDDTVKALGWPIIKKWPPSFGQEHCVVWPRGGAPDTMARRQRRIIGPLLNTIFHEGGQTICIDEAAYIEDPIANNTGLGLSGVMSQYWGSARSLKLSLIAGTQRPRNVTRSMWSEPSWVFIFAPDDEDDLMRVAQLSGAKNQVLEIAPRLGGHEFLCVHRPRGSEKKLYVSKVGT